MAHCYISFEAPLLPEGIFILIVLSSYRQILGRVVSNYTLSEFLHYTAAGELTRNSKLISALLLTGLLLSHDLDSFIYILGVFFHGIY